MNWQEVVESPHLRNLPFKIELNEQGQIIMTPVKIGHSIFQGKIITMLDRLRPEGVTMAECAIWTRKGTKSVDVAWASAETIEKIKGKTEADIAPEICVEVLSMSNTEKEMREKRKLYFERGAHEVWICDEYGVMSFFDPNGMIERSKMFVDFPLKVEIPKR